MNNPIDSFVMRFNGREYVTDDELVSVYCCSDKTWRVSYYPFCDKDRNMTEEMAFKLAAKRHKEALSIIGAQHMANEPKGTLIDKAGGLMITKIKQKISNWRARHQARLLALREAEADRIAAAFKTSGITHVQTDDGEPVKIEKLNVNGKEYPIN